MINELDYGQDHIDEFFVALLVFVQVNVLAEKIRKLSLAQNSALSVYVKDDLLISTETITVLEILWKFFSIILSTVPDRYGIYLGKPVKGYSIMYCSP